jgi:hypothetical protein
MKYSLAIIIFIFPLLVLAACSREEVVQPDHRTKENVNKNDEPMKDKITITVATKVFTATLEKGASADAFKALLPLTLDMKDLNSNEKFFDFSNRLPTDQSNPPTISTGDLMLWGSNTLVLFYRSFSTSYSYTRLGKVENTGGLAEALGSGNVTVRFELQE